MNAKEREAVCGIVPSQPLNMERPYKLQTQVNIKVRRYTPNGYVEQVLRSALGDNFVEQLM